MARNDRCNRKQRTARRDFWRSFPMILIDRSDLAMRLPFAAIFVLGAFWVWSKQKTAAALAAQMEIISPVMKYTLEHVFGVYLVVSTAALLVLLLYPLGRKATEDELHRVGLVNHTGEAPCLLRKQHDKEHPHITIWEFDNRGIPLDEWEAKRANIETAMDINIVKIVYGKGKCRILLYAVPARADLPSLLLWKDEYLSPDSFVLTLGESLLGPVMVNLAYIPHVLLGGSTGSGKSVLLKLLLMQALQKGAVVCIADFKGGVDFPAVWRNKCRMCFTETDLLELLTDLVDELERRKKTFSDAGCSNIDRYNEATGEDLKRFLFACDEVAEVLDKAGRSKEDKEVLLQIENKLATIARQGRAFGIHLILATQRPDASILPGQIKNNLDFRVCGRADNVLSQIILDSTSAADLIPKDARGRFLLHDGTVFQAYWLDENNIGREG